MTEVLIHPDDGSAAVDKYGNVVPLDDAYPDTDLGELSAEYEGWLLNVGLGGAAVVDTVSEQEAALPTGASIATRELTPEQDAAIDRIVDTNQHSDYEQAFLEVTGMSRDKFFGK